MTMASIKKKKTLRSSTPQQSQPVKEAASRSSERIRRKQCQRFEMPSKQEMKDTIYSSELSAYTPRKLINDYTKENSRYNTEYLSPCASSDSDAGDFIDDEESEIETSEEDEQEGRRKNSERLRRGTAVNISSRVGGKPEFGLRRKRNSSVLESDSSSEASMETGQPIRNSVIDSSSDTEDYEKTGTAPASSDPVCKDSANGGEHERTTSGLVGRDAERCDGISGDAKDSDDSCDISLSRRKRRKRTTSKSSKKQIVPSDSSESELDAEDFQGPRRMRKVVPFRQDDSSEPEVGEEPEVEGPGAELGSKNERISHRAKLMAAKKGEVKSLFGQLKAKSLDRHVTESSSSTDSD